MNFLLISQLHLLLWASHVGLEEMDQEEDKMMDDGFNPESTQFLCCLQSPLPSYPLESLGHREFAETTVTAHKL